MIKQIIKRIYNHTLNKVIKWYRREILLKNKDFTIISNNCWGGGYLPAIWASIHFPNSGVNVFCRRIY